MKTCSITTFWLTFFPWGPSVRKRSSSSLPNTSTFLPDICSQCQALLCLAHHAVHLWCSPKRWQRRAVNSMQIRWKTVPKAVNLYADSWKIHTFLLPMYRKMAFFDKKDPLVANTQLHYLGPKRLSRSVAHLLLMADPLVSTNSL